MILTKKGQAMIRAKLIPSTNGNGSAQPAYKHVPSELREAISHILETEGMMTDSAENRILARIDSSHKETLSGIGVLRDTLHDHDKRLTVVELDVKDLNDAQKAAADERRNTSRLVKGAIIVSAVSILVGIVMSVWGPSSRAVPEVKQDAAAISTQLTDLIKEIRQDREERKAEQSAPANTSSPTSKSKTRTDRRRPEPLPGPQINMLRPGEMHADSDPPIPIIGFSRIPIPEMKVPE